MRKAAQIVRREKGFTIVELLIVIAILGVLAVVLISALDPITQLKKGRDTRRKQDIAKIKNAFEQIRNQRDQYPCFSGHCGANYWDIPTTSLTVPDAASNPFSFTDYLPTMPTDPTGISCASTQPPYLYVYSSDGTKYTVFANLENNNDPLAKNAKAAPVISIGSIVNVSPGTGNGYQITSGVCSGKTYNYWVNND